MYGMIANIITYESLMPIQMNSDNCHKIEMIPL